MNFVVIDVETANADLSSICQVGIARFVDGRLIQKYESLVNPEDEFDDMNVSIHGIDEEKVRASPNWAEVYPDVNGLMQDKIVVSHTFFDRVAVSRACEKYELCQANCQWLDSARVVRRTWPSFSKSGYGLANVASEFGIQYKQHDAFEDARCAGEILLKAITETGLSLDEWLERVKQPIHPVSRLARTPATNPNGPLHGEVLVFTGALSVSRGEAASAAADADCEVDASVTKRTTILSLGRSGYSQACRL